MSDQDWNDWADGRIAQYCDKVLRPVIAETLSVRSHDQFKVIGQETAKLVRDEVDKLRSEFEARLRTLELQQSELSRRSKAA